MSSQNRCLHEPDLPRNVVLSRPCLPNGDAAQEFHQAKVRFQPGDQRTRLDDIPCGADVCLQAGRLLVPALRMLLG